MKPLRNLLCTFALALSLGSFFSASAQAQVNMRFDDDVQQSLRDRVIGDFDFLNTIQSTTASPLHQEIFGAVDGPNYLRWFNSRVFYFGVDECGGPGSVACVMNAFPNKIFVTNNYVQSSYPQIARLMTVFHEARHTEVQNGSWEHALCPHDYSNRSIWTGGALNDEYACDSSAYGSYASASIMLNNISKNCTNCSSKVKSDAKVYSDDQVKRVIDAPSLANMLADFAI
jgi:hypothetical protein